MLIFVISSITKHKASKKRNNIVIEKSKLLEGWALVFLPLATRLQDQPLDEQLDLVEEEPGLVRNLLLEGADAVVLVKANLQKKGIRMEIS